MSRILPRACAPNCHALAQLQIRRALLLGFLFAAAVPGSTIASTTCTPPPAGLVSWWSGEGNANDVAGANNGVLEGTIGFAPGEVGESFSLETTNADVRVPASASLDVGAGAGFTVETWINPANTDRLQPICEWNNGSGQFGVHFYISVDNGPGTLYANIVDDGGWSHPLVSTGAPVQSNVFQHVALTYDKAAGVATIYCNGAVVEQASLGSFRPLTSYALYLGRRPPGLDGPFGYVGLMDEPSLYNRALSQGEIQTIYSAGSSGKCLVVSAPAILFQPTNLVVEVASSATFSVGAFGSAPLSYQWLKNGANIVNATNATYSLANVASNDAGSYSVLVTNLAGSVLSSNALLTVLFPGAPVPPPSGLAAWWRAEGGGTDAVGPDNANLLGGAAFAPGMVGQGFQLNGTSAYLQIPASQQLNVGQGSGLTLEMWIKPSDVSGFHPILEWSKAGDGAYDGSYLNPGVHFWLGHYPGDNGVLYANVVDTNRDSHPLWSDAGAVRVNEFQHVALTYDQALGIGTLYINGAVVSQVSLGAFMPETSEDLWISRRPVDYPGSWTYNTFFAGLLDEVSVYKRALTASEIQSIYLAGSAGKYNDAPSITAQPTNLVITAGSTASFSVVASSDAPLAYQWFKDRVALTNGTGVAGSQSATLILNNVFASAKGNYSVDVFNTNGATGSQAASLSVVFNTTDTKNPPKVAISSPSANHSGTNSTLQISGTASTKKTLAGVWYRLNDGDWLLASGLTNWTGTVQLTQTTNILRAVAMDTNGCISSAASVQFYWAQMASLVVQIQGQGDVSLASTNRLFQVGKTYTLTASPKAGWYFSAWEGDLSANSAKLTFVMQPGLVLQADFTANPFYILKGSYSGLVSQSGAADLQSSGQFTLNTTESGAFSGLLQLDGVRYPLSGRFGPDGSAALVFRRPNQSALSVQLALDVTDASDLLTGSVSDDDWYADLQGHRAQVVSRTNSVAQAGQYTLMFSGDYSDSTQGSGHGYGTVKVDKAGKLTLAGALADGTKLSQSASVAQDGSWPLYIPLYGGKGLILSWMSVDNGLSGTVSWIKPTQPKAKYFPSGFSAQMSAWGSPYVAPGKDTNMLNFSEASLVLKSDGTTQASRQGIQLESNNRLSFKTVSGSLSLVPTTGLFKGTVTDPITFETYTVQGVVLQNWNIGCGYFLGHNSAGGIIFGPSSQLSTYPPDWLP